MAASWEYQVIPIQSKDKQLVDELNAQGKDGWELIQVSGPNYIFKRSRAGQIAKPGS
jgi:hypothetical protein